MIPFHELDIPDAEFDVAALQDALDAERQARGLSWQKLADQLNRIHERYDRHPISASTLSTLKDKRWGVEGDGVLQSLLWLDRTPESFVPGHPGADHPDARLQRATGQAVLRFDVPRLGRAMNALRQARGLTWADVAHEVGGMTPAMMARLGDNRRTGFPKVMRYTRWLHRPAAEFTRIARS